MANLDGRSSSGYDSAAAAWSHFLATGAAHPATSADGLSPPAGAWLYYGYNHVVVYLGNNLVAGTDTWGSGTAKIGPAGDVQRWLASQGGYRAGSFRGVHPRHRRPPREHQDPCGCLLSDEDRKQPWLFANDCRSPAERTPTRGPGNPSRCGR